jgi:hypothetical protein
MGYAVYAAAYLNEAQPELSHSVAAIEWMHPGQIKRLLRFFRQHDIGEAVMMGGVRKTRMFTDIKPDLKAMAMIAGMKHTHDDNLLRHFADLLEKEGITIRASTFLLPEILADKGCWTRRKPSPSEQTDIELGWRLAKEIGRLDIGQCLVLRKGTVLAVEAVDGTDATIQRGGALGRGGCVVVKVSKPHQDLRFDVPAIGVETIHVMHQSGAAVLAIEAGRAVVFDKEEMIRVADRCDIAIVAL